MKKYVGITIGPIFDTISDASQPASLWYASGIFSDITKRLCAAVVSSTLKAVIISPYYDGDGKYTGVGKYHDRVIFSSENFSRDGLDAIIDTVKTDTVKAFPESLFGGDGERERAVTYLKEYLQIHYVVLEEEDAGKNAILGVSDYLDALELSKTIPGNNADSPLKAMLGNKADINALIKETDLFKRIPKENSQFLSKWGAIKSIEEIAGCDGGFKKSYYYATVAADGDGMGKCLQGIGSDGDVVAFSKVCLTYAEDAAEMIRSYGGMTVYAGGDDLLFLAPVEGRNGESIVQLCNAINGHFREIMRDISEIPTISFGVAVRYYKFPLYEAIEDARSLLGQIKGESFLKGKNAIALDIRKHSGQVASIFIPHGKVGELSEFLDKAPGDMGNSESDLHSILYKLENMEPAIAVLDATGTELPGYTTAVLNFFDNPGQKEERAYLETLVRFYYEQFLREEGRRITAVRAGALTSRLQDLIAVLRIRKFLVEKGGEE